MFLNIVDIETNFQIVAYLGNGPGNPPSRACEDAFMQYWVSWAGWPTYVDTDRSTHNRAYLEPPEQMDKVEQHGNMWKTLAKRTINAQGLTGDDDMRTLAYCFNTVMNDGVRKEGLRSEPVGAW
ncbi:hypothetical protein N9L19_01245 [bacterium]|nr:hypothetical protein [bacterium]